jgi:hypothetical protein
MTTTDFTALSAALLTKAKVIKPTPSNRGRSTVPDARHKPLFVALTPAVDQLLSKQQSPMEVLAFLLRETPPEHRDKLPAGAEEPRSKGWWSLYHFIRRRQTVHAATVQP